MTTPKTFLRLVLAEEAFKEAVALADHIVANHIEPRTRLYSACITGIFASYGRPFLEASGLGRLDPKEFATFSGPNVDELTETHAALISGRNKICAHFDLTFHAEQYERNRLRLNPGEAALHLLPDHYEIQTNHFTFNPVRFELIRRLLAFQIARTSKKVLAITIEILNREKRLGTFLFRAKVKNAAAVPKSAS